MANESISTLVDLLRHGEHELKDAICGVTDPALSDKGWGQLHSQCDGLLGQGAQWDICISSPRIRCAQFAEQISQKLAIPLVIKEDLAEIDFGEWEGLTNNQISCSYPGQWQSWLQNPDKPAPHGGEAYGEFLARINQSWQALIEQYQGQRVLLLSHGGVMRVILGVVLDLNHDALFRFQVPHACHSRISAYHAAGESDWFQLDSHNSVF
jgi:alpha-ribazole phosphatase